MVRKRSYTRCSGAIRHSRPTAAGPQPESSNMGRSGESDLQLAPRQPSPLDASVIADNIRFLVLDDRREAGPTQWHCRGEINRSRKRPWWFRPRRRRIRLASSFFSNLNRFRQLCATLVRRLPGNKLRTLIAKPQSPNKRSRKIRRIHASRTLEELSPLLCHPGAAP